MHLQGADARRQVDHALELLGFQRLHQRMATETQHQVQLRCADFQQQVSVAGEAGDQAFIGGADVEDDGRGEHRALDPLGQAPSPIYGRGLGRGSVGVG